MFCTFSLVRSISANYSAVVIFRQNYISLMEKNCCEIDWALKKQNKKQHPHHTSPNMMNETVKLA